MPFSNSSTGSGSYVSHVYSGDTSSSFVFSEDTDDSSSDEFPISDSESTDFVLLGHPLANAISLPSTHSSAACTEEEEDFLPSAFEGLSVSKSAPSTDRGSKEDPEAAKRARRAIKRRRQKAARKAQRAAQSEQTLIATPEGSAVTPVSTYNEAVAFISRYLASPQPKDSNVELQLLRSLVIELGVRSPNSSGVPSTLTSARKLIKSEVHINIKDYVATRDKGQSALKQIMHPSQNSLRQEIKKTGKRAPLKWVKKTGLQVLLIKASSK